MGMNKRYINQENLKKMIHNGSEITRIIDYIKKPDILMVQDEFSKTVVDAVLNEDINNLMNIINGEKER